LNASQHNLLKISLGVGERVVHEDCAVTMNAGLSRILLVEDDLRLSALIAEWLTQARFHVLQADRGERGLAIHARGDVDAIILDLMLPDMDGLEVCRRIRSRFDTPILMLTARGDAMDRVVGLEMGADDYLPKPFEPMELLARLRAILRRQRGGRKDILRFGQLEIDRGAREVRLGGVPRSLTGHQFELLLVLAEHAGEIMSRETLLDRIKGEALDGLDRSIDVHISRIRGLIESDARHPRRIITVRGAGYVFAQAQE
jgi:DNA-binding response OmpR family regulator